MQGSQICSESAPENSKRQATAVGANGGLKKHFACQ